MFQITGFKTRQRETYERRKLPAMDIRSRRANCALNRRSGFRLLAEGSHSDRGTRRGSPGQNNGRVDRSGIPRTRIFWKG